MALSPKRGGKVKVCKPITNLSKVPNRSGHLGHLMKLMAMKKNVLIIGTHGIGKTRMTIEAAKLLNMKIKIFSAATMDPYADMAGIPIPDMEEKIIEFFRDKNLDNYDIFFFDEFNRPRDIKILNGVFEIIQFKSMQGKKFKRLKMCWAAMNPPDSDYQVESELDPALIDRFHHYIEIPFHYNAEFFINKFGPMGADLIGWVNRLSEDKRSSVTPRRLEYIGDIIEETNNDLEFIRTSVFPGMLNSGDFRILSALVGKYYSGKGAKDSSSILKTAIDKQLASAKDEIDDIISSLKEDE